MRLMLPVLLMCTACTAAQLGEVFTPGQPGHSNMDLSSQLLRETWVLDHPEADQKIKDAILEGVFVTEMTVEHVDLITNKKREGVGGGGFWRSRTDGFETRRQWFVSNQREPFDDARLRAVCELVLSADVVTEVRYCRSSQSEADADG